MFHISMRLKQLLFSADLIYCRSNPIASVFMRFYDVLLCSAYDLPVNAIWNGINLNLLVFSVFSLVSLLNSTLVRQRHWMRLCCEWLMHAFKKLNSTHNSSNPLSVCFAYTWHLCGLNKSCQCWIIWLRTSDWTEINVCCSRYKPHSIWTFLM